MGSASDHRQQDQKGRMRILSYIGKSKDARMAAFARFAAVKTVDSVAQFDWSFPGLYGQACHLHGERSVMGGDSEKTAPSYGHFTKEGRYLSDTRRGIFRCLRFCMGILLMVWSVSDASAQDRSKRESNLTAQSTFRLPVNVVVVNATVTDKAGQPVTDLTANDFRVYDDGKPQTIQTFALESYGPVESEAGKKPALPAHRNSQELNATRPRMISIVIDDLTMESAADLIRMAQSITDFLKKEVGPMDLVAVLSGSGNVQFPFSDDPQQLYEGVSAALKKMNYTTTLRSSCPKLTDLTAWRIADGMHNYQVNFPALIAETMACLGLDDSNPAAKSTAENYLMASASQQSQIDLFRTRNLLYTMRRHIRALRHFEGPKKIVLFSDGFLSESGTPSAYQVQELIDLALRSGIVLNSVNIRGLAYEAQDNDDMMAQESPLNQMAYETGGVFFHNDNNLYKGLRNVVQQQSFHYILSYGLPSLKADGNYHHIKLEVARPGLHLSYRKGYYTQKEELKFENSRKEDILAALTGPGNMNEIPLTLSYNYFLEDDSSYAVSFVTNVNIRGLQFPEEDSRRKNLVSIVLVAFDENDHYISGLEKSIDFRLQESSYANLRDRGLTSRVELQLPLGRYKIKAVVRESTQGKIGSITKAVEIP
jgi:VWFA-related protein